MEKGKYTLGIDPGLSGAIAILLTDGMKLLAVHDMPTTASLTGKGKMVDTLELIRIMQPFTGWVDYCYIERVGPMPTDGAVGAFKFGRAAMVPEVLAQAYHMPIFLPTPGAWKQKAGLVKKEKEASMAMVNSMFPEHSEWFRLKKHIDRADAVLIAIYGRVIKEAKYGS